MAKNPAPVTVALMTYGGMVSVELFRSMLLETKNWNGTAIWTASEDALISRVRSKVATNYLEQGVGDVLVMIDHDINFQPGDLKALVKACRQTRAVVAGVYPKRGFGIGTPIRLLTTQEVEIGTDVLAPAQHVGTGFMAIHKSALVKIAETMPMTVHQFKSIFATMEYAYPDGKIEYLSEDYAFCQRAHDLGIEVYAYLLPRLRHFGNYMYTIANQAYVPPASDQVKMQMQPHVEGGDPVPIGDNGFKVYLDPEDRVISRELFNNRPWESMVTSKLIELAGENKDKVMLDIGASLGIHSIQVSSHYQHVYAVEPLPNYFNLLVRNIELNELENMTPMNVAIWKKEGNLRLLRNYSNPSVSHLTSKSGIGVPVKTITLSSLPVAEVIKIDAEGAEYAILKEAAESGWLSGVESMVFEYGEAMLKRTSKVTGWRLIELLQDNGFRITDLAGTEVTEERLPRGEAYINLLAQR